MVVKLSGGKDSASATEGSCMGRLGTVDSINFSEPVATSISTDFWAGVAAGTGVSLRGGGCTCELHLSSLSGGGDCCRGAGASGTSGSEGLKKGRGSGGDDGGTCFSRSKSERETFGGCG